MGRTEKDFQTLVIDTINDIRRIYSNSDTENDIEAKNKLINTVNFLEDIIYPYFHDPKDGYNPKLTGDEDIDIHVKIREIMRIAKDSRVITPLTEIQDLEDAEFYGVNPSEIDEI